MQVCVHSEKIPQEEEEEEKIIGSERSSLYLVVLAKKVHENGLWSFVGLTVVATVAPSFNVWCVFVHFIYFCRRFFSFLLETTHTHTLSARAPARSNTSNNDREKEWVSDRMNIRSASI